MGFKDWWKLARLEHAFFVAVTILASEALAAKSFTLTLEEQLRWLVGGTYFNVFSWTSLFPLLGPFFITAASFIFNDYRGFESDKANQRFDRPLVKGSISKAGALKASVFLYALGLLLSFYVNSLAFFVALVFSAFSLLYDPYLKRLPLLGNLYIASSMGASFLYGNVAVTPKLHPYVLLFFVLSFLAGVGRELLITLRDVKGDQKQGMTTLPMLIGAKNTILLSTLLFLAAMALIWVPLLGTAPKLSVFSWPYFLLVVVNNLFVLYALLVVWKSQSKEALRQARNYTLYALAIGILAFVSLAF